MAYIGNTPALQYITHAKQTLTADSSTVAFTLSQSVANENELEVFVNNVRQEPGSGKAYTASGTTLTMSEAPTTGDGFYCIYQGKATQTVTPGASTVTNDMLSGSIANAKLANSSITLNSSAVSLGGSHSIDNTPVFLVKMDADQTISTNTFTKLELDTETYDTDNAFASFKFTVPSGEDGKYVFHYAMSTNSITSSTIGATALYKNGSMVDESFARSYPNQSTGAYPHKSCVLSLSAGDYVELYGQHTKGSNADIQSEYTFLAGHKLIGV